MNRSGVSKFLKNTQAVMSKHSPGILIGVGVTGMCTMTVLAVRATPKALKAIDAKKEELGVDKLTPMETVKATWKFYVPAAVSGVAGTACILGASSKYSKRNAMLATAYKLSETALSEYEGKVKEIVGDKKEQHIREKVNEDRMQTTPVTKSEIIVTERGNTLCFDSISKRYFKSDINHIKKAENILNKRMLHDICGYVSLNDFYDELGLDHIEIGDDLGWNTDNLIDIDISSGIADNDDPCIVVGHSVRPKYGYADF